MEKNQRSVNLSGIFHLVMQKCVGLVFKTAPILCYPQLISVNIAKPNDSFYLRKVPFVVDFFGF